MHQSINHFIKSILSSDGFHDNTSVATRQRLCVEAGVKS